MSDKSADDIIAGYIAHNPGGAEKIIGKNYVVMSMSAIGHLGKEIWRAGATDIKDALIEHIQTLPLDAEFSKKMIAQVNSVQDRYSRY